MSATTKCHHPNLKFAAQAITDPDRHVFVHLSASCEYCGAQMRFVGIEPQLENLREPTIADNGFEIILPMVAVTP